MFVLIYVMPILRSSVFNLPVENALTKHTRYSQSTTNKMQRFIIYFCKTFYMFQAGFPSIIRSPKLHIQHQVFVRPILLPVASLSDTTIFSTLPNKRHDILGKKYLNIKCLFCFSLQSLPETFLILRRSE